MTCLIYILWGVDGLDLGKIGRQEISKMIATVLARDGDGGGGAE